MSRSSPRVALLLVSVGDLSGSGGTERQFTELFEHLRDREHADITLVTSSAGLAQLQATRRLQSTAGVIALDLGSRPARTKAGIAALTAKLLWEVGRNRWDVVHICQPTPSYVPMAAIVSRLPARWRPRLAMTVVDCTLAHNLRAPAPAADLYERQVVEAHRLYFNRVRLDGIYSWYRAFADSARALGLAADAEITAANYCFTDTSRFQPGDKQRQVIFAGRLSVQKRPLLFVEAVASLVQRHPAVADGWQFLIYGSGPLEPAVRQRIAELDLTSRLEVTKTADMAPVFARSKLLVSPQAYENFTSLAMLEAMAAGNAVVAADVGQTSLFVKHGDNGLLAAAETPAAFADAMAQYLMYPELHDRMAASSRRIATEVHTVKHFAADIQAFWRRLASP